MALLSVVTVILQLTQRMKTHNKTHRRDLVCRFVCTDQETLLWMIPQSGPSKKKNVTSVGIRNVRSLLLRAALNMLLHKLDRL